MKFMTLECDTHTMLSSLLRPVAGGWISHAKLASVKCIHPQKVCGVRQHMLPVCSLQWEYMQRRMNLVCGFVSGLIGGQEFPCCNCIGKLLLMCRNFQWPGMLYYVMLVCRNFHATNVLSIKLKLEFSLLCYCLHSEFSPGLQCRQCTLPPKQARESREREDHEYHAVLVKA